MLSLRQNKLNWCRMADVINLDRLFKALKLVPEKQRKELELCISEDAEITIASQELSPNENDDNEEYWNKLHAKYPLLFNLM